MWKHIRSIKSNSRTDQGTSVVEFALVSLIFFVLIFGIIEVGRWVYLNNTVHLVAQEGARLLVGDPSLSAEAVKERIVARGLPIDPDRLEISVSTQPTLQQVEVIARYPYTPILPLVPLPGGTVEARATLSY